MTTRELYNEMLNVLNGTKTDGWDELAEIIEANLSKMDSQNETRRAKALEKAAEKQALKAPIRDAILGVMGDNENPKTATTLIAEAGLTDSVNPASIPSLMRPLVEAGIVGKVDVKVTGKGTHRGYIRI